MSYYYSSGQDYYPSGDEVIRKVYRNIERGGHKHHHHHSSHHGHHHHHHHHAHQTIVNDGTMVINGDSLRQVNSVIYNRPGSTVYMTDAHYYSSPSSSGTSYYYGSAPRYSSGLHACRGCSGWHRELAGGYCRGCIEYKVRPGRTIEVVRESRRALDAPERRLIQYHR